MRLISGFAASLPLLLFASLCRISEAAVEHGIWDYEANGPKTWAKNFPQYCAGRKQSPVDLGLTTSVHDPLLAEYNMRVDETTEFTLKLQNDGHKLQVTLGSNLVIKKGLRDTMYYTADQLHWHWGAVNTRGSEHTIAGRPYPMEGHLVFWNSLDFASFSTAVHSVGGLAVLGVFYELSETDNPLILAIEPYLPQLINANSSLAVNFKASNLSFLDAFLPKSTRHFYRYEGSLTTPTCNENVLWTVYTVPAPISARQLALMRSLRYPNGKPCVDNYRPVQPLNPVGRPGANRVVYRTFDRRSLKPDEAEAEYGSKGVAGGPARAPALTVAATAAALGCLLFWTTAY